MNFYARVFPILLATALLCPLPGHAQGDATRQAALFDRPVATQRVQPVSPNDQVGEIRCTYYSDDVVILETGTDTPAPGPASVISFADASRRTPCAIASRAVDRMPLKTANHSFIGRMGPFLFFAATDPNGAVPFMILDVSNGHSIYSDGMVGNGIEFAALENGLLHLRFRRGFNASCSVLQASASCWGQLLREGKIPRALAQSPPPSQACALAYQTAKAPIDDPSIIFYDVDMTIDDVGRTTIISRGAVGCDAMP